MFYFLDNILFFNFINIIGGIDGDDVGSRGESDRKKKWMWPYDDESKEQQMKPQDRKYDECDQQKLLMSLWDNEPLWLFIVL